MRGQVLLLNRSSGRYLAPGAGCTARAVEAVEFDSEGEAVRFLERHACEPGAWSVVAAAAGDEAA